MASVVANNINNNENSNLDVQLHNSKKFVSMLQQTAWVLNNLIKNYNANYNDVNNNTKVAEQEDDKEIKQDNKKPPSNNMTKKSLMMQLRKVTLLMEQIQLKMELGLLVYSNNNKEDDDSNTVNVERLEEKRNKAALSLFNMIRKSNKIIERIKSNVNIDISSMPDLRKAMLKTEIDCLEDDYRNEKFSTETAMFCLKQVVLKLRDIEETFEFHSRLIQDRNALMVQFDCNGNEINNIDENTTTDTTTKEFTNTNFAYGSTPFSTFSIILSNDKFHIILKEMKRNKEDFVVFGSSAGWLNFYASLAFGLNSKGFEILPSLVNVANQVKHELNVNEHASIDFYCMDMLMASLENTRIIMLCSQCWDRWLIDLVHEKLINELQVGGIIIDYNDLFASSMLLKKQNEGNTSSFELFFKIKAPVSWNPAQEFSLYIKK